MKTYYQYRPSPAGEILLIADSDHLIGLHWTYYKKSPKPKNDWISDRKPFEQINNELDQYFDGKITEFKTPTKFMGGTKFQNDVWNELTKIPFGKSSSYGEIAKNIDNPKAVRAVGSAVGNNPISILVPCHRVLSSQGGIAGYAGGLPAKSTLLKVENIRWK